MDRESAFATLLGRMCQYLQIILPKKDSIYICIAYTTDGGPPPILNAMLGPHELHMQVVIYASMSISVLPLIRF